jgi:hypothetical protein
MNLIFDYNKNVNAAAGEFTSSYFRFDTENFILAADGEEGLVAYQNLGVNINNCNYENYACGNIIGTDNYVIYKINNDITGFDLNYVVRDNLISNLDVFNAKQEGGWGTITVFVSSSQSGPWTTVPLAKTFVTPAIIINTPVLNWGDKPYYQIHMVNESPIASGMRFIKIQRAWKAFESGYKEMHYGSLYELTVTGVEVTYDIPVESIVISGEPERTMPSCGTLSFNATVLPSDATESEIQYFVFDEYIDPLNNTPSAIAFFDDNILSCCNYLEDDIRVYVVACCGGVFSPPVTVTIKTYLQNNPQNYDNFRFDSAHFVLAKEGKEGLVSYKNLDACDYVNYVCGDSQGEDNYVILRYYRDIVSFTFTYMVEADKISDINAFENYQSQGYGKITIFVSSSGSGPWTAINTRNTFNNSMVKINTLTDGWESRIYHPVYMENDGSVDEGMKYLKIQRQSVAPEPGCAQMHYGNLYALRVTTTGQTEAYLSYDNGILTVKAPYVSSDTTYQFWIKQKIRADGNTSNLGKEGFIWKLFAPYQSDCSASVDVSSGDYLKDEKYEIIVKIKNGSSIKEIYRSFDPAEAGQVKITSLKINGIYGQTPYIINKTKDDLNIKIDGNGAENTVYRIYCKGFLAEQNTSGLFKPDITSFENGFYNFELEANNGNSADKQTLKIYIYGDYDASETAIIESLTGSEGQDGSTIYTMRIIKADSGLFSPQDVADYNIKLEDMYGTISLNKPLSLEDGVIEAEYKRNYVGYGIIKVTGSVSKKGALNCYDKFILYYEGHARSATLTLSGNSFVDTEHTLEITANGSIDGSNAGLLYAFYREDANGWVLIKDYSTNNVLNWKPFRAGLYNIQARIKTQSSINYEKICSKIYTVSGPGLEGNPTLTVIDVSTQLEATSYTAGSPYIITAAYKDGCEDVLFMFTVYNASTGLQYLNTYTVSESILFTPNKPGNFIVTVRVINVNNFGFKDKDADITINAVI